MYKKPYRICWTAAADTDVQVSGKEAGAFVKVNVFEQNHNLTISISTKYLY